MKPFFKLSFVCLIAFLFSSCGKKNEAGKMIPSNAGFVAQVNFKSLGDKLSWKEIQQTEIYKKGITDSSLGDWKKKLLENPSTSGIDFEDGIIFFTASHNGNKYFAAEGKIKDKNEFEQFNKNFETGSPAIKKGNISLLKLKENNVVGWNEDNFIYIMNPENQSYDLGKWNDLGNQNNTPPADRSAEFTELCAHLFSLATDSSLAKSDKFAGLLKEPGDFRLYQNTDALLNNSGDLGMLGMLKLDAFTKGNISTYTIDFDKGKINVSQKMYVSKELTDLVKKYMGTSVNMDLIKDIPSKNILGLITANFKPEGIVEMIRLTGFDGMINSYTQPLGFSLDDLSKATNGDWLIAFTDFNLGNDSAKINPEFNYVFSSGVGDKSSLNKILAAAKKTTSQMGKDSAFNYVMNDKMFAISNSYSFANQYVNGNTNNTFDFDNKISGHPVGFYFDIHKLLSQFSSAATGKPGKEEMLDQSLNTWNNIISYGGDFKDGGFAFNTEINLVNKDTNSLKQLSDYFNQMYMIHEKEKSQEPDLNHRLDSLLVPPPADTVK